jgi:hypothetical protein
MQAMIRYSPVLFALLALLQQPLHSENPGHSVRNSSFLPAEPFVLNFLYFPSPRNWTWNYAPVDGNHTLVFSLPKNEKLGTSIAIRFREDETGEEFDRFQKVMQDLQKSGAKPPEQLPADILEQTATKKDAFMVYMANGDIEFLTLYYFKNYKQFVAMRLIFSPKPALSSEELSQVREMAFHFIQSVKKIEVVNTMRKSVCEK